MRPPGLCTARSPTRTTDRKHSCSQLVPRRNALPCPHPHQLCPEELLGLWPHPPAPQPLRSILRRTEGETDSSAPLKAPGTLIPRGQSPRHKLPALELIPQRTPDDPAPLSTASFPSLLHFSVPEEPPPTPPHFFSTCLRLARAAAGSAPSARPWAAARGAHLGCLSPSPAALQSPRAAGGSPSPGTRPLLPHL